MRRSPHIFASLVVVAMGLMGPWLTGCTDEGGGVEVATDGSCVGCHTDYALLKEIAAPDSVVESHGCGGDAPHIEPYDRVYLGGSGYEAFASSVHGELACTACHGGVDSTADKVVAHGSDFVKSPSRENPAVCAGCHEDIVGRFAGSLHFEGWGQKNSQIHRAGVSSFEGLPEGLRTAYAGNCATCHAACGECHVTRPLAGGGGLLDGHRFQRTPDMRDNCTACHSSRGGHAYYGVAPGTQPDVHLTAEGFTCLDCHTKHELHGDGTVYEHRYQTAELPTCTSCHAGVESANPYHAMHFDDFNCQTCHSQDYNNCGSCHVAGEGARLASHQSFKIARNPIPEDRPYRFVTVRRTPAAPDTWSLFGVPSLDSFAAKTTFNFTTPHNILRWTTRTQVPEGAACYASCHLIQEGDTLRNRELYLFRSDLLLDWEQAANESIVVDGHLPASWGTP